MSDDEKPDYAVGYGKPPEATRFKPGQSGNRKGRPKGAKNLSTIVSNAIKAKVPVTINGKRKMVSKIEVAITQMANKAASGDAKAFAQLLPLAQNLEGKEEAAALASAPKLVHEADKAVMGSILHRVRKMAVPSSDSIPVPTEAAPADSIPQTLMKKED